VIYLHMLRGIMYGSYKTPRELLWLFGMIIYLALMAEAFMGYVLPWGNMSFWAATVIINLFGAIPVIGPGLVEWIRGDYGIADATLNRFFSLHVVALPLLLLLLVVLHLVALHEVGSNNPDGVEIKDKKNAQGIPLDGIPFHPYYTVKDIFGVAAFLTLFAIVVFFIPTFADLFLEKANFEPANPLSTPDPISPSWYFTPYYAILRSFPDKSTGAVFILIAVYPLSRLDLQDFLYVFRAVLPWAHVPGPATRAGNLRGAVAHLLRTVLPVLRADAFLHALGSGQTRACASHRPCVSSRSFFWPWAACRSRRLRPNPRRQPRRPSPSSGKSGTRAIRSRTPHPCSAARATS